MMTVLCVTLLLLVTLKSPYMTAYMTARFEVFPQPVWSVSREWQPLLVANSGTAVLYMSAFASLCKRQPPIILLQCA
jgi:hypothetical protein